MQINPSLILNTVYPVGSIYMSVNSTNPSTLFGGTWAQLKDRFLLGCGDTYSNGATGGEATHKLTVDEMPSHSHSIQAEQRYPTDFNGGGVGFWLGGNLTYRDPFNTGGDQPHNNMPPYLAVYMWKRTA